MRPLPVTWTIAAPLEEAMLTAADRTVEIYNCLKLSNKYEYLISTHQSHSYDLLCPDHGQSAGLQSLVNVRVDQENIAATHHRQEGTTAG